VGTALHLLEDTMEATSLSEACVRAPPGAMLACHAALALPPPLTPLFSVMTLACAPPTPGCGRRTRHISSASATLPAAARGCRHVLSLLPSRPSRARAWLQLTVSLLSSLFFSVGGSRGAGALRWALLPAADTAAAAAPRSRGGDVVGSGGRALAAVTPAGKGCRVRVGGRTDVTRGAPNRQPV